VKNLDDTIARAEIRNPTICKSIHFCQYEDNPNICFSVNNQELLDKLKILDYMEKEKSKSATPPPNLTGCSTNYQKLTVEIPPIDIDRSQF
jgi:hypothetical protein